MNHAQLHWHTVRRQRPRIAALLVTCVLAAPISIAWAATEPADPRTANADVTTLDEVVVTGQLGTLSGLAKAIHEAEDRFHTRFNEVNKQRAFDIQCRYEAPTGTRLKVKTCDAKAVEDGTRAEALKFLGVQQGPVMTDPISEVRANIKPDMQKRMREVVAADAVLRSALLEHARLVQMYEDLRAKKLQQQVAVWD